MSYSRRPYYILGSQYGVEFYKNGTLHGTIPFDAMGQFVVNLIVREKEFLDYVRKGLACLRQAHAEYRKEGTTDPGDRPLTKLDVLEALQGISALLEREIKHQHRRPKTMAQKEFHAGFCAGYDNEPCRPTSPEWRKGFVRGLEMGRLARGEPLDSTE